MSEEDPIQKQLEERRKQLKKAAMITGAMGTAHLAECFAEECAALRRLCREMGHWMDRLVDDYGAMPAAFRFAKRLESAAAGQPVEDK